MVGQHGLNLAVSIVTAHLGAFVGKVCGSLLHRGSLSLQEIVRDTGFSPSRVKDCLLVLIQHNCVQAYSIPRPVAGGALTKTVTQYVALFDNILHRLRFSKFLGIVSEEFGDEQCVAFLEGLLQHGRLTFEQLVMRATAKESGGGTNLRDSLRSSFNKLIQARYIERCPRSEPFISPVSEDETSSTRKRSVKSAMETQTFEQQALTAAALLDAERFSGLHDNSGDKLDDKSSDEKAGDCYLNSNAGEKRKHEELEIDKETQDVINESEVLWRANFEKFIHCLKKKVCVASVRARLSLDAAVVLESLIESSNQQKPKENSVTSSLDGILEWVMKKPGGRLMTMQHVRSCLEELKCEPSIEEAKTLYSVDLGNIIKECQIEEVESLVRQKYGTEAYRIFRLLVKRCRLVETDSISDITFVDKKTAQGILYKLWMDNYLHMEMAFASSAEKRFLWKVNTSSLYGHILNDMHRAALNLSQRIAQNQEELVHLQTAQKKQCDRLRNIWIILETSLLKLDDTLMLFHDF